MAFKRLLMAAAVVLPFAAHGQSPVPAAEQPSQPSVAEETTAAPDSTASLQAKVDACKAVEDTVGRLICFDQMTGRIPSVTAAVPAQQAEGGGIFGGPNRDDTGRVRSSGNWMAIRRTDSMTDAIRTTLFLTGAREIGGGSEDHDLAFRCFQGRLEMFVVPGGAYLGTSQTFRATYRFDGERPVTEQWQSSVNGKSAFGRNPRDTFTRLLTASRMLLEIEDFRGGIHRIVFDPMGIKDVADQIDACTRPRPAARR